MSEINQIINRYKEIQRWFRHPPNAVPDTGINLVRGRAVTLTSPSEEIKVPLLPPPDKIELPPQPSRGPAPLTFQSTLQMAADAFGVTVEQMEKKTRARSVVLPRQVAIYLSLKYNRRSIYWISRRIGFDHTTVIHSKRRIERLLQERPDLKIKVEAIEQRILSEYLPPITAHNEPYLGQGAPWDVPQRGIPAMD